MSGPDIPDLAMAMPIAGIQAGTNSFTLIFHHRCITAPIQSYLSSHHRQREFSNSVMQIASKTLAHFFLNYLHHARGMNSFPWHSYCISSLV